MPNTVGMPQQQQRPSGSASRGLHVDENVLEELEFHKQTVETDDNSPLHLIREKEMEISGRVLAAKRQADEIVGEARREQVRLVSAAHDDANAKAKEREVEIKAEMERKMVEVRTEAEAEVAALEQVIASKKQDAVATVIESVVRI